MIDLKSTSIMIYISSDKDDCEINCDTIDEAIKELQEIKNKNGKR